MTARRAFHTALTVAIAAIAATGCASHPTTRATGAAGSPAGSVAREPGGERPAASVSPSAATRTGTNPPTSAAPPTTTPGRSPAPAPQGTMAYPQYAKGTVPAPMTATLAHNCLANGGGQVLTVQAPAGYYITVDAQYSDSSDGQKHGGFAQGVVPDGGTYVVGWTVHGAPTGTATVFVAVEGGHPTATAFRQPQFKVAASCPGG